MTVGFSGNIIAPFHSILNFSQDEFIRSNGVYSDSGGRGDEQVEKNARPVNEGTSKGDQRGNYYASE